MIIPIRENVLYLYVNGEFFRAYAEQEELSSALTSMEPGVNWTLYDNLMNEVGRNG